jgi:hypothetical protein
MHPSAKLLFLACLVSTAFADSWLLPDRQRIPSPNGEFVLDLVPSNIRSQIDYFQEEDAGRKGDRNPCWARLFRQQPGGEEEVLWTADLDNNVAPVEMVVADSGNVVVGFDNWHSIGYGPNVLAVYGEQGKLRFRHSLEELMPPGQIRKLTPSMSSRRWRRGCWLDENRHEMVLATLPGPLLVVDLESGAVRPGGEKEIRNSLSAGTGAALALPLELAEEMEVQDPADYKRILNDASQPVAIRLRAALALRGCGDRSGERLFIQEAKAARYSEERAYALEHLPRFLGLKAVSVLQEAMHQDSANLEAAKRGLASLQSRAVPDLLQMLRGKGNVSYRAAAAEVLGKLNYPGVRAALLDALGDRDEPVANTCFNSLRDLGFPKDFHGRSLRYLTRGTQIDRRFAGYFTQHRDSRSPAPLLTALKRHRSGKDFLNGPEQFVAALEFQTGTHLGQDVQAWELYLKSRSDREARASALLGSGNCDGWLLLPLLPNRERLARELVTHLRLVDQRVGSRRWGEAVLDPNGSVAAMPYSGDRWGLLSLPGLSEKSVTVRDVYERHIAFSLNGEWVLLPGGNNLAMYSVKTGLRRGQVVTADWASVEHTDVANDGSRVLEAADEARIWGFESQPAQFQIPTTGWGNSRMSPDGRMVALMHEGGVTLVDLETSERVELEKPKAAEVLSARFLADSKKLATWDRDGAVDLWDLRGNLLQSCKTNGDYPEHWSVSESGFMLGHKSGTLVFWDGRKIRTFKTGTSRNLSFHGDYAVTSGEEDWLRIWQVSTGRTLAKLATKQEGEEVHDHASIAPDGQHLVTLGSDRNRIKVWRLPGLDVADTDVPPELLREQLKRATGRQLRGDKIVDLTLQEYQAVVRRCIEMEAAHRPSCRLALTRLPSGL